MGKVLDRVNYPQDLRKLKTQELKQLSSEIRKFLLENVSKTGGHLASNLGVVELTLALHTVFDTPNDKLIWDVGHQSYVHKIVTGRKDKFSTLRKLNGLSGFPKGKESEYDCFDTGHSSTSISLGLGMARSRDIKREEGKVISIIGDGALTGGMAFEALNDAGSSKTDFIVVLNDNEMSISKNVGGLSNLLTTVRTKKLYTRTKKPIMQKISDVPTIGNFMAKLIQNIKNGIKQLIIPKMIFEELGFTYLGPVDGNNISKLKEILMIAKEQTGPILVHVITKKGKGYKIAENAPDRFHGISSFDIGTGICKIKSSKDYSAVFGEKIVKLAGKDKKIVGITAAMTSGTGLYEFSKKFNDRFFDVGIAEQHAVSMAAGMAKQGLKPIVVIYSSFLQRAYDQIIHDICIQKLPVILCVDRAGIVGNDGETHQGIFDLSYLSHIPNMTIVAPKNFKELEDMVEFAVEFDAPIAIRYPRGGQSEILFNSDQKIEYGVVEKLQDGNDITIMAIGKMVTTAVEVANILKEKNISATVINSRFVKPLDQDSILDSIKKTKKLITIEDNIIKGGFGCNILEMLNRNNIDDVNIRMFGYPDEFILHGAVNQIEEIYGLDKNGIANAVLKEMFM